jgi:hypothetical protein
MEGGARVYVSASLVRPLWHVAWNTFSKFLLWHSAFQYSTLLLVVLSTMTLEIFITLILGL